MGLPVICTEHENQRSVVQQGGLFIDMRRNGRLTELLRSPDRPHLAHLGREGRRIVEQHYDLQVLKRRYLEEYVAIAASPSTLPVYSLRRKLASNLRNAVRASARLFHAV
jgi:glycosyltransferase involved in cell wall biosynthesis